MTLKVGYQGNHGTFSEIAALRYFADRPFIQKGYSNFTDILNDCDSGELDYALLPVENTTTGIIARTYDLFQKHHVHAVGEINVPIHDDLIVLPGTAIEDIREVYSHPEAISQCSRFFSEHPQMKPVYYQDTAKSVEYIKSCGRKEKAALASSRAAEYYEMESLQKNVQNSMTNITRFFCVTAHEETVQDADKISMMLILKHQPGSLYQVLKVLADRSINLLKLESRPIQGKVFEYSFYLDFCGNTADPEMQKILSQIQECSISMSVLGCYRAAQSILNTENQ